MNDSLSRWRQPHDFRHAREGAAEKRLRWVIAITVVTMVAELAGGYVFGSMALIADGWHMGSHAAALSISVMGYVAARYFVGHVHFTFGTGKIGPLTAYTSAMLLGAVAIVMAIQSVQRLISPIAVHFDEALAVATVGLLVNIVCAWLLRERHAHGHGHARHAHHHDQNLAAAYLHVLADALTSLLAIAALLGGKLFGWVALDAAMGLVGAVVIAQWSIGLARRSGRVLLDAEDTGPLTERVRDLLEAGDARVADLHLWRVGLDAYACIATVVTREAVSADTLKARLAQVDEIRHVTIEVNRCE
ncbi:MAG: CDF family Co(II)/Ni(II) efflux transporter DmeF [Burkholderiales bacterium]|nr:CDF family Co(II)/Ni(II) efflux transporter DmeF [Burkholderiales bacterium]